MIILNALGLIGISATLLVAYLFQFTLGELPCPLCLLQRVAFVGVAFGLLLNVRYGPRPQHYGILLLSALFGMGVSGRQILLHIVPGTGSYGSALIGLHFYTWAFVLFGLAIVGTAVLLILQPEEAHDQTAPAISGMAVFAGWSAIVLTLLNATTTFIQCGPIECPDNPVQYWLLQTLH